MSGCLQRKRTSSIFSLKFLVLFRCPLNSLHILILIILYIKHEVIYNIFKSYLYTPNYPITYHWTPFLLNLEKWKLALHLMYTGPFHNICIRCCICIIVSVPSRDQDEAVYAYTKFHSVPIIFPGCCIGYTYLFNLLLFFLEKCRVYLYIIRMHLLEYMPLILLNKSMYSCVLTREKRDENQETTPYSTQPSMPVMYNKQSKQLIV